MGLGAWAVLLGRVSLVGGVKNQLQEHQEWGEHCPSQVRGKEVLGQESLCLQAFCYLCYHHCLYLREYQWKKKSWEAACHLEHQT